MKKYIVAVNENLEARTAEQAAEIVMEYGTGKITGTPMGYKIAYEFDNVDEARACFENATLKAPRFAGRGNWIYSGAFIFEVEENDGDYDETMIDWFVNDEDED